MEGGNAQARKVIIVADPTKESTTALHYALSHVVQEKDELILLHVENPNWWKHKIPLFKKSSSLVNFVGDNSASADGGGGNGGELDFLEEMKHTCEIVQPKARVCIDKVEMEGKEKAELILSRSIVHDADLLIVGQRRKLSDAILGHKRTGSFRGVDTAEFLIENSKCTCVSVQKKGNDSGYIINTKNQKHFWLLA